VMANARFASPRATVRPCNGAPVRSTICTLCRRGGIGRRPSAWKGWGCSLPGRARIFVVDKGGASVSADRPGSRRFATMAQIESKHDVRRKVRDAQAQVNRERLKRESDNREDMVAFLVAEQKLGAVSGWEAERHAQVRLEPNNAARSNAWKVRARWRGCVIAVRTLRHRPARRLQRETRPQVSQELQAARRIGHRLGEWFASTRFRRCGRCVGRFAGTRRWRRRHCG